MAIFQDTVDSTPRRDTVTLRIDDEVLKQTLEYVTEKTETYRTTKEIGIDAAHRVPFHESKCKSLHGHRYRVIAHIEAEELGKGSESGMTMDFGVIKDVLMNFVDYHCDHATILWVNDEKMMDMAFQFIVTGMSGDELVGWGNIQVRRPDCESSVAKFGCWSGETNFGKTHVIKYIPTAENLARYWYEQMRDRISGKTQNRASLAAVEVWETPTSMCIYPAH